jgi:uncharacterized integral membrane protein
LLQLLRDRADTDLDRSAPMGMFRRSGRLFDISDMDMTDKPIDNPPPQEAPEAEGPLPHEAKDSPRHEVKGPLPGERRTRLSGAWTAIVVGLIGLVVILIFILQNQQSVEVSFLAFSGHLPLAVALLFALILGALVVFAFGAARILQLRRVAGRARRQGHDATPPAE